MHWRKVSVMICGIGLVGLTSGCSLLVEQAFKQVKQQQFEQPKSGTWKGGRNTRRSRSRRIAAMESKHTHPQYRKLRNGMMYDQVVGMLGQPQQQSGSYVWSTLEGEILVKFNAQNQAYIVRTEPKVSREKTAELRKLVAQRPNYTTISAHLGGDATSLRRVKATWIFPQKGEAVLRFQNNKLMRKSWRRKR